MLLGLVFRPMQAIVGTPPGSWWSTKKFYFFDVGVSNAIADRFNVRPKTSDYGKSLEHLIFCELRSALLFGILGTRAPRDFRALLALADAAPKMRKLLICEEPARRNTRRRWPGGQARFSKQTLSNWLLKPR